MTTDDARAAGEELIEAHRLGNPDALDALWDVLAADPACDGYDPRDDDEQPCAMPACGALTTLRIQHPHWGRMPVCASCWDPQVHDPKEPA